MPFLRQYAVAANIYYPQKNPYLKYDIDRKLKLPKWDNY